MGEAGAVNVGGRCCECGRRVLTFATPRPSLMAQTTSDWPRLQSPAAKTPSAEIERLDDGLLRVPEPHGQDDQIGRPFLLRPGHFLEPSVGPHGDVDRSHRLHLAGAVRHELLGEDRVAARIVAKSQRGLLVPVVHPHDARPERPRVACRPFGWGCGEELKVGEAVAAVPERGSNAVCARVSSADDDHVLARGGDELAVVLGGEPNLGRGCGGVLCGRVGEERVLVLGKELHGVDNAVEIASGDGKVVGHGGADGENRRVEVAGGADDVLSHFDASDEADSLFGHQVDAALHRVLVQLHVGDA
eukprot:scaffold29010_cov84-Isochrysis_galbana.AAC.1